jgi:hypothetical protein
MISATNAFKRALDKPTGAYQSRSSVVLYFQWDAVERYQACYAVLG